MRNDKPIEISLLRPVCQATLSRRRQLRAQANVAGRCTDLDFEYTGIELPGLRGRIPERKRRAAQPEGHRLRFVGSQFNSLKSLQLMNWSVDIRVVLVDVQLNNFGAFAGACVADLHADLDWLVSAGLIRPDFQIAIRKGRIAQPEAEGELRFNVFGIEVAIANVNTFCVVNFRSLPG